MRASSYGGAMKLFTSSDLREQFQVSRVQFWRWRVTGQFPEPTATIGRKQFWTERQIESFIQRGGTMSRRSCKNS